MVRKNCINCFNCSKLYIKGLGQFEEQKIVYCRAYKKAMERQSSCDDWLYNSEKRKNFKKEAEKEYSTNVIDKMEKNLSEIRQILSEK